VAECVFEKQKDAINEMQEVQVRCLFLPARESKWKSEYVFLSPLGKSEEGHVNAAV
jgi:hypothetical protein